MKRFCAAILTLSLLAAALSGCGAAQSAPETTAAQTTFPTETAAPETTVPETQPTTTVDAVPVPQYSQYEAPPARCGRAGDHRQPDCRPCEHCR